MTHRTYTCDVAVIGGGLGGVAAALAACDAGATVVLSEATRWLGGQATSQGVAALDEHRLIETFGATRSYAALRAGIRAHYTARYGVERMPDGAPLNPGNAWVSGLCFEPRVAVAVIDAMLAPHVASGRLTILYEHEPVAAEVEGDSIRSVALKGPEAQAAICNLQAAIFLDATDLGDLLPLVGAGYVAGAESRTDTGEALAPEEARPGEVQSFTFCFAVEHRPGEDHTIPRPPGYERLRDEQPFTLTLTGRGGELRPFAMFTRGPTGLPPFWTYRRLLDGQLLDPSGATRDIALVNWPGNDYRGASIIDVAPEERARALAEARRLSLAFLHWLQTEVPRDDGGRGYPGLRLLPEVMGTADGLAMAPYVRESRRILALRRVVAEEILAAGRPGARAAHYSDSVGVGWYPIDLHAAVGSLRELFEPTLPFQIPLGALVPRRVANLLAACKNIGVTHLSGGAYRLHPVEWNVGEAAGALAAMCCAEGVTPHEVAGRKPLLLALQRRLLLRGVPLAWAVDVPEGHPAFAATQLLLVRGALAAGTPRFDSLEVRPDAPLTGAEAAAMLRALCDLLDIAYKSCPPRWETAPDAVASGEEWRAALRDAGIPHGPLGDPPAWAGLVMAYNRALR
ncbi:MAG TPA: FAD-dependent oxidoreductase [Roseiflexaceae bacterium]|nr:FAD-dependent oxidoreductase [Roseiflexaceae bacterium]